MQHTPHIMLEKAAESGWGGLGFDKELGEDLNHRQAGSWMTKKMGV